MSRRSSGLAAPDPVPLEEGHPLTAGLEEVRGGEAGNPATDYDHVDVTGECARREGLQGGLLPVRGPGHGIPRSDVAPGRVSQAFRRGDAPCRTRGSPRDERI